MSLIARVPGTNYCGEGWSEGKYQESVDGILPATGPFDETCKQHDAAYFHAKDAYDRGEADIQFLLGNLSLNPIRLTAGLGVYVVNRVRGSSKYNRPTDPKTMSLRGSLKDLPIYNTPDGQPPGKGNINYKPSGSGVVEVSSDGQGNVTLPPIQPQYNPYKRVDQLINDNMEQYHVRYNPYDFHRPGVRNKYKYYKSNKYWM